MISHPAQLFGCLSLLLISVAAHAADSATEVFETKIAPSLIAPPIPQAGIACVDSFGDRFTLQVTLEQNSIVFFGNGDPKIRATFNRAVSNVTPVSEPGKLSYTVDFVRSGHGSSVRARSQITVTYAIVGGKERLARVVVRDNDQVDLGTCDVVANE